MLMPSTAVMWRRTAPAWVTAWWTARPPSPSSPKMLEKVNSHVTWFILHISVFQHFLRHIKRFYTLRPKDFYFVDDMQSFSDPRLCVQVVCLWRSRVHLKPRSAVKTTKTGRVLCPTCPPHLEITTSSSSLMTNTSPAAPSPPGSLVPDLLLRHEAWLQTGSTSSLKNKIKQHFVHIISDNIS